MKSLQLEKKVKYNLFEIYSYILTSNQIDLLSKEILKLINFKTDNLKRHMRVSQKDILLILKMINLNIQL